MYIIGAITQKETELNIISLRPVISQDFSWFHIFFYKSPLASKFSWKKSSHQGKKEVAWIVSSSFLLVGMWRVCKSSKIKEGTEGLIL